MTRRSRTRGPVCSLGWARRRNGALKILVIFGHEVFVALEARALAARVSYDRDRGHLRIVPHPEGETPIGAVNVRAEHCRRDRDKRYSLYVDVPADVGPGPGVSTSGSARVIVPHTCSAGVLTVSVPATFAARVVAPPPPEPEPEPAAPASAPLAPPLRVELGPPPRRLPPMPTPPQRLRVVRPLGPPPHHNPFGDPTPERSALGQGYTPGSGLMRQR
jgi:hypothetical protein